MANSRKQDIDYIRAILKTGSFLAASDYLHISQPAISQFIARIERENGIRLFDRTLRPVALTEEGSYYLKVEEEIEVLRKRRAAYFSDLSELKIGHVRIGTNQCRTSTILADILGSFVREYPQIKVEVLEGPIRAMDQRMLHGEVDFTLTLEAFLTPQMMYRTIHDENILIALPPGHPLGERARQAEAAGLEFQPFEFRLAAGERFIRLNRGLKFHDYLETLCADTAGAKPQVILETESITTVLELVSKGVGCGLVPDSLVFSHIVEPRPHFYTLKHLLPMNRVVAAWNKDYYLSKAAAAFIDRLVQRHRQRNSGYMEKPAVFAGMPETAKLQPPARAGAPAASSGCGC